MVWRCYTNDLIIAVGAGLVSAHAAFIAVITEAFNEHNKHGAEITAAHLPASPPTRYSCKQAH